MFTYLNLQSLESRAESLQKSFESASPFRHIAMTNVVHAAKLAELRDAFPSPDWVEWNSDDHEHQRFKKSCSNISKIPEPLALLIHELNSGPFLRWLEHVTGVSELLPDPHLNGGGLHVTTVGGWLTPHTDFHTFGSSGLYRRSNLLLYLNEDWKPENNGYLELWDKKGTAPEKQIKPELGQCVIFQTDDVSVHGFSKPVVDRRRCSVALYYYSVADTDEYSGSGETFWRPHSGQARGFRDRIRYRVERGMLVISRFFAAVSWRIARAAGKLRK